MTASEAPLLLEVDQLNVAFTTERGRFSAVNDITFRLGRVSSWPSSANPAPARR